MKNLCERLRCNIFRSGGSKDGQEPGLTWTNYGKCWRGGGAIASLLVETGLRPPLHLAEPTLFLALETYPVTALALFNLAKEVSSYCC
jgi:hypothetical protein